VKKILIPALFFSTLCKAQNFSVSLGGDYSKGNVNTANIDLRAEVKQDSGRIAWNISPTHRFSYLTTEKRILNNETYITASAETRKGRWKFLAFNENERSYNRKIVYRGNAGMGVSYHVVDKENLKLIFSEVVLPEVFYSEVSGQRKALRLSSRVKFFWKSGAFSFNSVSVIQPSILNSPEILAKHNFVMRSQNSFEIYVTRRISMVLGADVIVQTYPTFLNEKVKPVDYRYYTSLKFKL
jgi:hypothetical protein